MDRTIEGKVYINGTFETCCIGIKQGKISTIKKILKDDEHIDFGNKLILPAGVDLHVHFRDPGFTKKEDFKTGSMAAAFGGITCIFDMPNTNPPTTTPATIEEKSYIAKKMSYIDYGIFAGITDNNVKIINRLAKQCSGFKIYLGETTNSLKFNTKQLKSALQETSKTNKITLIHAEDEQCLRKHKSIEHNLKDHLNNRPSECEVTSVKTILECCNHISSKIHFCHISSYEGLEVLKRYPNNISLGVTPHHLFFDISNVNSNQAFYKVNPPIRTQLDRETLWQGIISGFIDVIESDHAPHTLEEKEIEFEKAPSGIPGVETTYPLFLAEVKHQRISFARLISSLCEKPAQLLNIPKGKIEKGMDADFIVIDFKKISTINSDNLHSKCGWTPFENFPAIFPTHVFIRGEKLIEEHEIQVSRGFGKFVGV